MEILFYFHMGVNRCLQFLLYQLQLQTLQVSDGNHDIRIYVAAVYSLMIISVCAIKTDARHPSAPSYVYVQTFMCPLLHFMVINSRWKYKNLVIKSHGCLGSNKGNTRSKVTNGSWNFPPFVNHLQSLNHITYYCHNPWTHAEWTRMNHIKWNCLRAFCTFLPWVYNYVTVATCTLSCVLPHIYFLT